VPLEAAAPRGYRAWMRTPLFVAYLLVVVGSVGCDSDDAPPALEEYFEAHPYGASACNAVDDRLMGQRNMRLYAGGGVQMLPITQGLASYYHRHSLSFATDAQPAKATMPYAVHNDQAALLRDLQAKYPGVDLTDEAALMASDPALYIEISAAAANFLLKPLLDFVETHSDAGQSVTNMVVLAKLESNSESITGPGTSLAGLAISPALLAEFARTGDDDAAVWQGVDLPATFTPITTLGSNVLARARSLDPVLDDLVVAHEFGHSGGVVHSAIQGNLMYRSVTPGLDDCTNGLNDEQLAIMANAYGLGPTATAASALRAEGVAAPAPVVARFRDRFPPARMRAMLTGDQDATRAFIDALFAGARR